MDVELAIAERLVAVVEILRQELEGSIDGDTYLLVIVLSWITMPDTVTSESMDP